jgi:hypothetical protein
MGVTIFDEINGRQVTFLLNVSVRRKRRGFPSCQPGEPGKRPQEIAQNHRQRWF